MVALYMQGVGPVATRYKYGLQSVATVTDSTDPHEFADDGVQWDADCPPSKMAPLDQQFCNPDTGKVLQEFSPFAFAAMKPFRGYNGVQCKLPGRTDLLERAQAIFDLTEWQYMEEQAWTGSAGGSPFLSQAASTPTDVTPVPGTAVSLAYGVGLLDTFLGEELGQLGTIWSPREIAGVWFRDHLATPVGGTLFDPVDNKIVLANGATVLGPTHVAAAAGKFWVYATGPVVVRRSPLLSPDLEAAYSRVKNLVFAIVERSYEVGWPCKWAAVLVDPTLQ